MLQRSGRKLCGQLYAIFAAMSVLAAVSACGQRQSHTASKVSADVNLGCDNDACLTWVGVTRRTVFRTSVGDLVEVTGLEFKRLKDGTQKSQPKKFKHLALCSKSFPAYLYKADGKVTVDWLAPNSADGVFGYNQTDYLPYLESCHSVYGQDIQDMAARLGYAVDPKFVDQAQFASLRLFGEALADEGMKRGVDASLIGTCQIRVGGHSYSNGRCHISISSMGGSKSIEIEDILTGYFAYINQDDEHKNSAEGSWNGIDKGSHAQDELGTLTVKGDCWVNKDTSLCYRWLPTD